MRNLNFVTVLALSLLFVIQSKAADHTCKVQAVAKCMCPASMILDCGKGFSGHVADDEKPKAITIAVFDGSTGQKKDIVLQNPPKDVRSYYGDLTEDSWITKQLGDRGIISTSKTQIDLVNVQFPESLTLYDKWDKTGPKQSGAGGIAATESELRCVYLQPPTIINSAQCNEKVCSGTMKCWKGAKLYGEGVGACRTKAGGCPTATVCANDESTTADTSTSTPKDAFESSLPSSGKSAQ